MIYEWWKSTKTEWLKIKLGNVKGFKNIENILKDLNLKRWYNTSLQIKLF